jgi:hypothetical protein
LGHYPALHQVGFLLSLGRSRCPEKVWRRSDTLKVYGRHVPSKKGSLDRFAWVAKVSVSDATAEKIRAKHHLDPADIVAAVQAPPGHLGRRDQDGEKVYLIVRIGQKPVLVVLYPAGDDVWRLASAYVISGGQGA